MSSQTPIAENQQEFKRVLSALIRTAERADVDVCQTQDIVADGGGHWQVEITRVYDGDRNGPV